MQLSWPSPLEYNEAIQNPLLSFLDPELQRGEPELNQLGLPRPATGNFAIVYKMMCSDGNWAVRCFLKSAYDQELRYSRIAQYLQGVKLSCTVNFEYQPDGIRYKGRHLPILKMEWVDGVTLDNFVNVAYEDKEVMLALAQKFFELYTNCQASGIAHGDLQHGNIMVKSDGLYLVDYDGMYVPSMKESRANELGHRNYQHPLRASSDFGPSLDNFSAWVILGSLYAVAIDSSLWRILDGGEECLLFRQSDFRLPASSQAFSLLGAHKDEKIRELSASLFHLSGQPVEYVPPPHRNMFPDLGPGVKSDWNALLETAKNKGWQGSAKSGNGAAHPRSKKSDSIDLSSSAISSNPVPATIKTNNEMFDNGRYAEAAEYYEGLLSNLASHSIQLNSQMQLECLTQLGYCHVYLGNMKRAAIFFGNGQVYAKAHNLFLPAMRCSVCMLMARFADGQTHTAEEFQRYFPSHSDMLMAIRAELNGPMVNNPWFAKFIYHMATIFAQSEMAVTRAVFDSAIVACTRSVGEKSLLMTMCLYGRAMSDAKRGFKPTTERDILEAMEMVTLIEGSTSSHLQAMRLDLIRILIKSAVLQLQPGDFSQARAAILRAFAEVDKLKPHTMPLADFKQLVSKTLTIYSHTKNEDLLTLLFEKMVELCPEKPALIKFLNERVLDSLDFGHIDEARILLTNALEELVRLPANLLPPGDCKQLLSATERLLLNCEDKDLANLALQALKHQGGINEAELAKLAGLTPEAEEGR